MATHQVVYCVSNDLVKVSSQLPSNKNRSFLVHTLVKALGLFPPPNDPNDLSNSVQIQPTRPTPASVSDLTLYHDRDYIEYVLNPKNFNAEGTPIDPSMAAEFGIEEDCPWFRDLPMYVRLVAGASLAAANALVQEQANIAINWEGGRHHAQKSQASGFCYVADCILAILTLKRARIPTTPTLESPLPPTRKPRIMYLDLDLHFSDGVSHAFYGASGTHQVLTLSIHHAAPGFFPISSLSALPPPAKEHNFDPFTLSIPLSGGANCQTFFSIWTVCVERVKGAFRPDYVVLQCGVDGLAGDTYGIWNWSLGGREDRNQEDPDEGSLGWCVDRVCHSWGCKTLLLGGGGYNSPNVARAWAYLTSIAAKRPLSLQVPIPDHNFFPHYAPSFTLDVPPNNMPDQNSSAYLADIKSRFEWVCDEIRTRV